ncbi:MAG: hypothetical protein ACK5LC_01945 [Coprobacillaceae bacterium]
MLEKQNQVIIYRIPSLTFTTPEGVETVFEIQLNIGGHQVSNAVAGLNLAGEDITYDVANGPITWDELRTLASVRAFDGSYVNTTIYMEAVQATLDRLNEDILNKRVGVVPVQFLLKSGNAIGTFNVTLIKQPNTYTVTYTDSEENIDIFPNQVYTDVVEGSTTPQFVGSLERAGYRFLGWTSIIQSTVTQDIVYAARWEAIPSSEEPTKPILPETPQEEPTKPILPTTPQEELYSDSNTVIRTGDYDTNSWGAVLFISGIAAVYFIIKYKNKYN